MLKALVFDIETGPAEEEVVLAMTDPFDPTKVKGHELVDLEWDVAMTKYGNATKEESRQKKEEESRVRFAKQKAEAVEAVRAARTKWAEEAMDRAPLSALTGRVLAIGYLRNDGAGAVAHLEESGGEMAMLEQFWGYFEKYCLDGCPMVGFNSSTFDVPFLYQRSVILGVGVPEGVLSRRRYLHENLLDLREVWGCGQRQPKGKLGELARAMHLGSKPEEVEGKHWWRWYFGGEARRREALAYLQNDCLMTLRVAARLGVCEVAESAMAVEDNRSNKE